MRNRLVRDIRYFLISQTYWWRAWLVYKEQASMWLIYSFFGIVYSYLTVSVIYNVSAGIAGWTYYQMLFLVSTSALVLNMVYYSVNIDWLIHMLRNGGLDPYLSKPYGRVSVFLSSQEGLGSTSALIGALVLLLYTASKIGFTPLILIAYLILLVAGAITLVLFTLMLIMLMYHLLRSASVVNRLLDFVGQASKYPLGVYGPIGQLVFTLVLPVGVASYYPARAFLSNISPVGYIKVLGAAFLISSISYILFNKLMEYYTSGGG